MNKAKIVQLSILSCLAFISTITMQNCSTKVDFAELPAVQESASTSPELLASIQALVYGEDAQDRKLLADKIAGYAAPNLKEIFNSWRRISGDILINKPADIKIATSPNSYCYTKLLSTGYWDKVIPPGETVAINPSTDGKCANQAWFAAVSWFYKDGRLHHATNSGNFNGFISGLKFDHYINRAVVTSISVDDDEIGVIIAVVKAADGKIHSLSASRSQGGYTMNSKTANLNWRVVYRVDNTVVKVFNEMAIGAVNRNSGSTGGLGGDGKGWNNRAGLIHVERSGDLVKASASDWGLSGDLASSFKLVPASEISLDLSDDKLGLSIFRGPQYVGYGMQSQPAAQFYDITFNALTDIQYIYDLKENLVYQQNGKGGYSARKDIDAFNVLGYPRKVGNVETQKEYLLEDYLTYRLVQ